VYTRYTNPTVQMFQDRLAALEGAESCVGTASGMAAILATALTHLKSGDHVVCSNAVFGATINLFNSILSRFGIETTYVSPTRVDDWRRAIRGTTRLLVVHSATKYLDGQGRVIAGAVAGSKALVGDPITAFLRTAGPTLSPFNAWVVLKGLETLELRMRAQSAAALELARWLEAHPNVARVHYPGLESHPQHALAKRQQRAAGSVLSFEVKGGRAAAWRVIDSTRLVSLTANLGDVKTTIIHPASTTHGRISPEARAAAGITEGLVRLAVGLEAVSDLKADLERGLDPDPDRGA